MSFRNILLFTLIFGAFSVNGQSAFVTKKIPGSRLQADFKQYKEVIEAVHPSLHWYTSKRELDSLFLQVEKSLEEEMTSLAFFQLLAPLTAKINCGHTITLPNYQANQNLRRRLPLEFRYLEGDLILFYDYQRQNFPIKKVKSINGIDVQELLEKMAAQIGTDGYISTPNEHIFNNSQTFGYRLNLLIPSDTYSISFKDASKIQVATIHADSLTKLRQEKFPLKPWLDSKILPASNAAVLRIGTFDKKALKNNEYKYKKYLATFFKEIKKQNVQSLIIDLRNNGGGEDNYGSLLYRYLTDEAFQYYQQMELNPVPFDKSIAAQCYLPDVLRIGLFRTFFLKKKKGQYLIKPTFKTKGLRKQGAKGTAFTGDLYILTNGKSYSATAEFAAFCKTHRPNTTFIGQECGGAMNGNTSAIFAILNLPNTQIVNYIPLVRYTMNIAEPRVGRGVPVDYQVSPKIKDLMHGTDTEMEFTLRLIKR